MEGNGDLLEYFETSKSMRAMAEQPHREAAAGEHSSGLLVPLQDIGASVVESGIEPSTSPSMPLLANSLEPKDIDFLHKWLVDYQVDVPTLHQIVGLSFTINVSKEAIQEYFDCLPQARPYASSTDPIGIPTPSLVSGTTVSGPLLLTQSANEALWPLRIPDPVLKWTDNANFDAYGSIETLDAPINVFEDVDHVLQRSSSSNSIIRSFLTDRGVTQPEIPLATTPHLNIAEPSQSLTQRASTSRLLLESVPATGQQIDPSSSTDELVDRLKRQTLSNARDLTRYPKCQCKPKTDGQIFLDPSLLARVPGEPWQCTRKCGARFAKKKNWKEHETNCYPQFIYVCTIGPTILVDGEKRCSYCSIPITAAGVEAHIQEHHRKAYLYCQSAGLKHRNGISTRFTGFQAHCKKKHKAVQANVFKDRARFKVVDSAFDKRCGFCRTRFRTWDERMSHLSNHFQHRDVDMNSWDPSISNDADDYVDVADQHRESSDDEDYEDPSDDECSDVVNPKASRKRKRASSDQGKRNAVGQSKYNSYVVPMGSTDVTQPNHCPRLAQTISASACLPIVSAVTQLYVAVGTMTNVVDDLEPQYKMLFQGERGRSQFLLHELYYIVEDIGDNRDCTALSKGDIREVADSEADVEIEPCPGLLRSATTFSSDSDSSLKDAFYQHNIPSERKFEERMKYGPAASSTAPLPGSEPDTIKVEDCDTKRALISTTSEQLPTITKGSDAVWRLITGESKGRSSKGDDEIAKLKALIAATGRLTLDLTGLTPMQRFLKESPKEMPWNGLHFH